MPITRLGPGNDTFHGTRLKDAIFGNGGNDSLYGAGHDDQLWGGSGADRLFGEAGNDRLLGEAGDDRLDTGDGTDYARGGLGADTIYGRAGSDFLEGGVDEFLRSDGATDRVFGGEGWDRFGARDASRDILFGERGNDTFYIANDTVHGGPGDDNIDVSVFYDEHVAGENDLTLGAGSDSVTFWLDRPHESDSLVRDFTAEDRAYALAHNGTEFVFGDVLFDAMDRNGDDVLDRADNGSATADGVELRVDVDAGGTMLTINGNDLDFAHVFAITADQWA